MIKIAIADVHVLVRAGLKCLLSTEATFRVVGEAGDGITAVELVAKWEPEVLLLELSLPRLHGLEVIRRVRSTSKTQIVVVTSQSDTPNVSESLHSGASGYILKDDSPDDLVQAIKHVATGDPFISPRLKKRAFTAALGSAQEPEDSYLELTERERVVLQHAAEGLHNGEIGQKLFISSRTVESHRANLMKKLRLGNQTDLVRYAIRRKIINP